MREGGGGGGANERKCGQERERVSGRQMKENVDTKGEREREKGEGGGGQMKENVDKKGEREREWQANERECRQEWGEREGGK